MESNPRSTGQDDEVVLNMPLAERLDPPISLAATERGTPFDASRSKTMTRSETIMKIELGPGLRRVLWACLRWVGSPSRCAHWILPIYRAASGHDPAACAKMVLMKRLRR